MTCNGKVRGKSWFGTKRLSELDHFLQIDAFSKLLNQINMLT